MVKYSVHLPSKFRIQPPGIDLLVFGFIFVLVSLILPFHDPDFYWHIKTGEFLWASRSLPTTDIFSYTRAGNPWVLHEWLSQLILYWVYTSFGFPGLRILTGLLFTLSFYIVNRLAYTLNTNLFHTTMITGVFLVFSFPSCSPRPQLFTFLFLAIFVYVLFQLKYMDDRSKLFLLPLIMVIWANSHGGYLIGLVLFGIIWATQLAQNIINKSRGVAFSGQFQVLSVTLILTVVASLLTPYSYKLWLYPFQVLGMDVVSGFITEWQSPNFHQLFYQAYLIVIMAYGTILIYSNRKPDLTELALSGAFIFLGFLAIRNIPLTVIVIAPLFALFTRYIIITSHSQRLVSNSSNISQSSTSLEPSTHSKPDPIDRQSSSAGWVLLLLCVIAAIIIHWHEKQQNPEAKINTSLPVAAVKFIKKNKITGRMFNNFNYGGYLIYEFYPDQKVFIDGRPDMYGDEFIREYSSIYNGRENWGDLFDKYSIDYALVGKHAPISQLLKLSGEFAEIYQDNDHILLIKKSPEYKQIIEQYAK